MKRHAYRREEAQALLPLLRAITREIEERIHALDRIEARLEELAEESDLAHELTAQAATHRRQLRLAHRELERLGCSIVGTTPLTLRIPGRVDGADHSFVWQRGNPVPH